MDNNKLVNMRRFKKFIQIMPVLMILFTSQMLQGQQTTDQSQTVQRTQTAPRAPARPFPDSGSIKEQFIFLTDKSNTYQDYRVIRESWILKFRTRLNDTINYLRTQIRTAEAEISDKTIHIDSLENIVQNTNEELSSTLKEKNNLSFLGISMSKSLYDVIMWVIIITLLTILGFLFFFYKRSYIVNAQVRKDLDDIRQEFDDYRKKALKSKEDAVRNIYEELKKYKK